MNDAPRSYLWLKVFGELSPAEVREGVALRHYLAWALCDEVERSSRTFGRSWTKLPAVSHSESPRGNTERACAH